jgi:hypothetical protein
MNRKELVSLKGQLEMIIPRQNIYVQGQASGFTIEVSGDWEKCRDQIKNVITEEVGNHSINYDEYDGANGYTLEIDCVYNKTELSVTSSNHSGGSSLCNCWVFILLIVFILCALGFAFVQYSSDDF